MPELPEVETTRRGLLANVQFLKIRAVTCRNRQLRQPISPDFETICQNCKILDIERRSKYLKIILEDKGYILIHLGMSGHLRILPDDTPAAKHDHVDIYLSNKHMIRYTDPRRFGMINWYDLSEAEHPLLKRLAPEPLSTAFDAHYFHQRCINKTQVIKKIIMNNQVVVGVGNIYAQECLFLSRIHPQRSAGSLTYLECERLVEQIKVVLTKAIQQGGTTLKDFKQVDGKPGYFTQTLFVYGKAGTSCQSCHSELELLKIDNRSTTFCPNCQI